MIRELENRAEGNTGATALAFGQSPQGSQTKAEVQTLMQQTNQLLNEVANNYLRGEKDLIEDYYKAYKNYMPARGKKVISLFSDNASKSQTLKKSDFIGKYNVFVTVESKEQIKKRNEKDFAKLNSVASLILENTKP